MSDFIGDALRIADAGRFSAADRRMIINAHFCKELLRQQSLTVTRIKERADSPAECELMLEYVFAPVLMVCTLATDRCLKRADRKTVNKKRAGEG